MIRSFVLLSTYTVGFSYATSSGDCTLDIVGSLALKYPPIITDDLLDFVLPTGTVDNRSIRLSSGQNIVLACPGTSFQHDSTWGDGPVFARCVEDRTLVVSTLVNETEISLTWSEMGCRSQPDDNTDMMGKCGPNEEATLIRIGFQMSEPADGDAETIMVCHDLQASKTLWSMHSLWDEISAQDHGNSRPNFKPDSYFDFDVNQAYTRNQQILTVAELVGSMDLAKSYIEVSNSDVYLARGHLAPNADFMFYSWMDSSFHFINVAPQWQIFNGKNWNYFEMGVRDFVMERGIDTVVYTGTHGVMELADINGTMVEIYLHHNNRVPVPRFYWKVIYDPLSNSGVAVVGVNNPHLKEIPSSYVLCPALEAPTILKNVHRPADILLGYMYACRVEDLASSIPEIPVHLSGMELLN